MNPQEVTHQKFKHVIAELASSISPGARDLERFRKKLADLLDELPDLLVQKVSVASLERASVEARTTWVGAEHEPDIIRSALRTLWPGDLFENPDARWAFEDVDESIVLHFAAPAGEGAKIVGCVKVSPA